MCSPLGDLKQVLADLHIIRQHHARRGFATEQRRACREEIERALRTATYQAGCAVESLQAKVSALTKHFIALTRFKQISEQLDGPLFFSFR